MPANTIKDLIDVIKANPGKYSFAHPGLGSPQHLSGEQFRQSLLVDLVPVAFTGAGPAIISVVGGHTPIGFSSLAAALPQVKDRKLKVLAVTSKTRSQALADVPTMAEAGHPDIAGDSWVGVLAPAGTPKEIVTLLHREIAEIIAQPDMEAACNTWL